MYPLCVFWSTCCIWSREISFYLECFLSSFLSPFLCSFFYFFLSSFLSFFLFSFLLSFLDGLAFAAILPYGHVLAFFLVSFFVSCLVSRVLRWMLWTASRDPYSGYNNRGPSLGYHNPSHVSKQCKSVKKHFLCNFIASINLQFSIKLWFLNIICMLQMLCEFYELSDFYSEIYYTRNMALKNFLMKTYFFFN